MRWFWQRRKKEAPPSLESSRPQERAPRLTAPRAHTARSTPLPVGAEPRDALLAFARDLLNAQGARVRVDEDDLVIATLPDGGAARYTTTLARARAEEETTLLTQGAPALESLFEESAKRARVSSATLMVSEDPVALALRSVTPPPGACGRCAHATGERWQGGAPTCDACPLRTDGFMLHCQTPPVGARVLRQEEEQSVEAAYRVTGHDRRGRRDEWLRLAFNPLTGERLPTLTLAQISAAQPASAALKPASDTGAATDRAQAALSPSLEALATYLVQRVGAEYQRRVEDITTTHERLKRERPDETRAIAAALDRELTSLAAVYGVEVEASLEATCFISSPIAYVVIQTANGDGPTLRVDSGRGRVRAPVCDQCGVTAHAASVSASGRILCAACDAACAHCGAARLDERDGSPLIHCGLCGELTCSECACVCDHCGDRFCPDHVWTCVGHDRTLCLRDLMLCSVCQDPLCPDHAAICAECGAALCAQHARACKSGGETLCARHEVECATCHQPVCRTHTIACEECGHAVCEEDAFACLGCGRSLCKDSHPAACMTCEGAYCARCRGVEGACPACRNLAPASDVDLTLLSQAAGIDQTQALKRAWLVGQNARASVYISRGLGREEAYVISASGEILASHRKGWRAR